MTEITSITITLRDFIVDYVRLARSYAREAARRDELEAAMNATPEGKALAEQRGKCGGIGKELEAAKEKIKTLVDYEPKEAREWCLKNALHLLSLDKKKFEDARPEDAPIKVTIVPAATISPDVEKFQIPEAETEASEEGDHDAS